MLNPATLAWRDRLILTRDITVAGARTEFYQSVRRGEFVRVRRGAYVSAAYWASLNRDARYRLQVQAAVALHPTELTVSHVSAVAIWQLPWFGNYPSLVHAVCERAPGGRATSALRMHAVGRHEEAVTIEGIMATSLLRTVVDVACSSSLAQAVVVADAALRRTAYPILGLPLTRVTNEALLSELRSIPISRGTARAADAIRFANGVADRPGESISRVNIALARLSSPILQAPIRGASGKVWTVDFWWPEFNLIGEFDGKTKYTDPRFLQGRTPEQAVYDEKQREDDLRAANHGMTRWGWDTAISMELLRAHLIAAGVRSTRTASIVSWSRGLRLSAIKTGRAAKRWCARSLLATRGLKRPRDQQPRLRCESRGGLLAARLRKHTRDQQTAARAEVAQATGSRRASATDPGRDVDG